MTAQDGLQLVRALSAKVVSGEDHAAGMVRPLACIVGEHLAPPLPLGISHERLCVRAGVNLAGLECGDHVAQLAHIDEINVVLGVEPRLLQGVPQEHIKDRGAYRGDLLPPQIAEGP